MKTNLLKKQKGFTIIEIMIVLAIAGLILLIVFLAVPALQRNSRNTQRRTDVANYLAAVNEWSANNQGKVPSTGADMADVSGLAKLHFYPAPSAAPTNIGPTGAAIDNTTNPDTLTLVTGAKCGNNTGTTNTDAVGSNAKSFAALYSVEGGGGSTVHQCQEG